MARLETIRTDYRRKIRKIMRKLNSQQLRRLYELAGPNLDLDRVPEKIWREWERDIREEFASVLGILYLLSWDRFIDSDVVTRAEKDLGGGQFRYGGSGLLLPPSAVAQRKASEFSKKRSDFLSTTYVDNIRKRLSNSEQEDLPKVFNREFGPDHDEVVAVTETANAIPQAEMGAAREIEKRNGGDGTDGRQGRVKFVAVWKHHDYRPPGHSRAEINPCPICSPLEGLQETSWPEQFKQGPPAHPNCDCHLDWVVRYAEKPANLQPGDN